jgi:hypothetical protein
LPAAHRLSDLALRSVAASNKCRLSLRPNEHTTQAVYSNNSHEQQIREDWRVPTKERGPEVVRLVPAHIANRTRRQGDRKPRGAVARLTTRHGRAASFYQSGQLGDHRASGRQTPEITLLALPPSNALLHLHRLRTLGSCVTNCVIGCSLDHLVGAGE